ncbi:MAG TPA: type VII secretion protein EsaA [Cellulomonas sp.]
MLVLLLVVALLALVLLPLNGGYQRGVAAARVQEQVLLEVALVNEDVGATFGGETVNLGRGFVTQVESDASASWHVVSRGVAESGLGAGGYQLVVVIPAGFSGTLLDLELEEPSPIAVTYQANGGGSTRIETIAASKGAEIVASLNAQLVDMYVASILGNLRQAQDNVRLLVGAGTESTTTFVDTVLPATADLDESLALLTERSDGLLTAGQDGLTGIADLSTATDEAQTAQGEHDQSLAELLAAREEGALSYAAFLESLLALDARLLSEDVQRLYDDLAATRGALADQLVVDDAETSSHAVPLAALQGSVDRVEASVRARADELAALDDAAVLDAYRDAAYATLDTDGDGAVSLTEVAAAVRGEDSTPLGSPDVQALLVPLAEAQIARLPYRSVEALDAVVASGVLGRAGGRLDQLAAQIAEDLRTVLAWSGQAEVGVDPTGVVGQGLDETIVALGAAQLAMTGGSEGDGAPADGEPADVDPVDEADPADEDDPADEPDPTEPTEQERAVATLTEVAARYGAEVTEIAQAYRSAAQTVSVLQDCAARCGTLPDLDVSAAVDGVVTTAVAQELAAERATQDRLTAQVARLQAEMVELTGSFGTLTELSGRLSITIDGQLDELATLRTSMATVLDDEDVASDAVSASDSRTRTIASEARSLLSQSGSLAAQTESAVRTGEGVQQLSSAVREDVAALGEDSVSLVTSADLLQQVLTGDVQDEQLFSSTFDGVLSNSYRSGVLNERMLGFLVSPVEANPRDPVASTDVSRPFSWVLIVFVLCLGAVCALSSVARRREPASAFSSDRTRWFWANVRALGPVTVVAVVLGVGIAWVSAVDLGVPRESQLRWAWCVVLACVETSLVVHALVRQWRLVGVGLSVLLPVGYVLVTDAVGAGAGGGLPALVARLDPLSHAERALVAVLGSDPSWGAVSGRMLLGTAVALAAGLLVRMDLRALLPARAAGASA